MTTMTGSSFDATAPVNRVQDAGIGITDQVWTAPAGGVISTLILEIAGNAGGNSFGIYNLADKNTRVSAFNGSDSAVNTATIVVPSAWNGLFGFYLANGSSAFYSRESDNGGKDNMVTLKTAQSVTLNPSLVTKWGGSSPQNVTWSPGEFLLAWEDLTIGGGAEPDFQDMIVKVNAVPVPEPTTMIAGALLLLPFGASTLRILRKNRAA